MFLPPFDSTATISISWCTSEVSGGYGKSRPQRRLLGFFWKKNGGSLLGSCPISTAWAS